MLYDNPSGASTPFIPPLPSPESTVQPPPVPTPDNRESPAWTQQPRTPMNYPYYPSTPYNGTPFIPPMPSVHNTPATQTRLEPPGSYYPAPSCPARLSRCPTRLSSPPRTGYSSFCRLYRLSDILSGYTLGATWSDPSPECDAPTSVACSASANCVQRFQPTSPWCHVASDASASHGSIYACSRSMAHASRNVSTPGIWWIYASGSIRLNSHPPLKSLVSLETQLKLPFDG
ncbi:hypothetical protein JVU11DRAFT_169 [Chiua virens]|nr:hypothetical protein JVU11DRAFT_169 [Chiua virens]